MFAYKLTLAYDGTHYSGWQIQPNAISIQELVQNALKILLAAPVTVIGSGRTDAGVHALNQVAHFHSETQLDTYRTLYSLNGLLPKDIRVKNLYIIPLDFHAQYSAISKEYHYHLYLDPVMDPFRRLYCWHVHKKLDLDLLKEAATYFLGTHDFTSFANEGHAGSAARNPIRTLFRLDIKIIESEVRLEFEGNGFLYKMVRNIVRMLVDIASGKRQLLEIPLVFEARDRRQASAAAPAQGLFLVGVNYPINEKSSV